MLGMLWCLGAGAATVWGVVTGAWLHVVVVAGCAGMMAVTLLIVWYAFARRHVPLSALVMIPWYIARKVPIYLRLVALGPEKKWVRTERANEV
jgi:hypothetical protein